jgi:hypothetical protein
MTETAKKNTVNIHYQKNPLYREIHVDGLIGGLTPRGKVTISFYAERMVIPKCEEHKIEEGGKLGELMKVSSDSKEGIIREIEFEAYLDIDTIRDIKNWLEIKIKEHETYFPTEKL